MESSVPRSRRKDYADAVAARPLYVAFFVNVTGYDPLTATTYAALVAGGATQVSASGTNYTTGGYALTLAASNLASNGAKVTASASSLASATFTCRYGVIYDHTTGKIEGISDFRGDKTVTGGTITVTWSTDGIFSIA